MRFTSAIILLGAVASSSASLFPRQAECAVTCISTADLGDCTSDNISCLCNNDAFVSSVTNCINNQCSAADRETAFQTAQAACQAVGVTLTSTPPPPTATAPTTGTTGAPATTTGTTTGSAQSGTATETGSGNGAMSNGVNALGALAAVGLAMVAL